METIPTLQQIILAYSACTDRVEKHRILHCGKCYTELSYHFLTGCPELTCGNKECEAYFKTHVKDVLFLTEEESTRLRSVCLVDGRGFPTVWKWERFIGSVVSIEALPCLLTRRGNIVLHDDPMQSPFFGSSNICEITEKASPLEPNIDAWLSKNPRSFSWIKTLVKLLEG